MSDFLTTKLAEQQIFLTALQEKQLRQFYDLLLEWNEQMNLTAITEYEEVYRKHFYDSLTPAFSFDFTTVSTLCDVGSGAGFPSVVLKIVYPHLQVTVVEALGKRIKFLQAVSDLLNLDGMTFVHERAEVYGRVNREVFDIVTARAVARMSMLAELCVPMLKVDGTFIVLKGSQGVFELEEAATALRTLGITQKRVEILYLEEETDKRVICFLVKGRATPQTYPRIFGKIKKNPL